MNPYAVVAAAGAAIVIVGLWVVIVGIYGREEDSSPFHSRWTKVRQAGARTLVRQRAGKGLVALSVAVAVWVFSGWPIGGLLAGVGVVGLPYFFGAGKLASARIERLEALEEWVRRLADSMSAGSAPVQTLVASATNAPAPIRTEVGQLASRLATPRLDRRLALKTFADDIDDPLGDMIVLALEIAVSSRASQKVPDVLRALASEVADEVKARRKVETDRAEPRNEARLIVIVQLAFVVGLTLLTSYTAVYKSLSGQLVLALIGTAVVLALWLLRRFSLGEQPPRILAESKNS